MIGSDFLGLFIISYNHKGIWNVIKVEVWHKYENTQWWREKTDWGAKQMTRISSKPLFGVLGVTVTLLSGSIVLQKF